MLLVRRTSIQQSPPLASSLTRFFCHAGVAVALFSGLGDLLGDADGLAMPSASGLVVGSSLPPLPLTRPTT